MENTNEPKEGLQESAEKLYDKLTTPEQEQPQESSPETEQPTEQPEGGSDPHKTHSKATPEDYKGVDGGFRDHPAWKERESKLKEVTENLKQKELEAQRYSKLLDDPEVYAKWLKQQGYSDAHIAEAMREKGFSTPQTKAEESKANQAQAIAERACANLGWDITRLNAEQKSYIQDTVSLTMAIIKETVSPMIDQRFGPLEEMRNEMSQQRQFNQEELAVMELAKTEFPEAGWEEVIKPAIAKFLKEMDEKDPKREIKMSYEDIYYRATRPLLRELETLKGRQEVRNTNKQNARPLGTAPSSKTVNPAQKGRSAREEAESFLDAQGVR